MVPAACQPTSLSAYLLGLRLRHVVWPRFALPPGSSCTEQLTLRAPATCEACEHACPAGPDGLLGCLQVGMRAGLWIQPLSVPMHVVTAMEVS